MNQEFHTDRLNMRPIKVTDAPFMYKLMNSVGWLKFIGDRNISNTVDAENYIQNIINKAETFYHLVSLRDENIPIGVVTFMLRDDRDYPDIGFAFDPIFQGKGYAYEASKKWLKEIKNSTSYEKIIAITLSHNTSSIGLLLKLGLEYEKEERRDHQEIKIFSCKT